MAFQLADLFATIRADDSQISSALPRVRAKLQATSRAMEGVARHARRMFLVVSGAVAGMVALAGRQEKAERMLDAALRSTGQSVDSYGRRMREAAKEIQRMTVYGDEFVLELMAQAVNLGAVGNEIDQYTRQAIGLATALKLDLNTAIRYVTMAHQGEFTVLQRYLPALRETTDATEQLTIVTAAAAAGMLQAEEETNTFVGQLRQLGNELSDVGEDIGMAFVPSMERAVETIRHIVPDIQRWITENQRLVATLGAVTLAVLAFLALAPKLLMTLSLIAAHPVVAAVIVLAGALGYLYAQYRVTHAAQDAFFARQREEAHASAQLADSIEDVTRALENEAAAYRRALREAQEAERAAQELALPPLHALRPDLRGAKREEERLRAARKAEERRQAADIAIARRRGHYDRLAELKEERAISEEQEAVQQRIIDEQAQHEWEQVERDMRRDVMSRHELEIDNLKEQLAKRLAIAEEAGKSEEDIARLRQHHEELFAATRKRHREEEHRERISQYEAEMREREAMEAEVLALAHQRLAEIGGGMQAHGVTGIAQFGRRIQEGILQRAEGKRRDELLQELVGVAREDVRLSRANNKLTHDIVTRILPILSAMKSPLAMT